MVSVFMIQCAYKEETTFLRGMLRLVFLSLLLNEALTFLPVVNGILVPFGRTGIIIN